MKRYIYPFFVIIPLLLFSCSQEHKQTIYQFPEDQNVKPCSVIFSSSGSHFLFVVSEPEGEAVVYDGKKGKTYPSIETTVLSASGEHFAYLATDGEKDIIVKDGGKIGEYNYRTVIRNNDLERTIQILNNGSVIYTQKLSNKIRKVIKDKKPIDTEPFSAKPVVSKDGDHLLYWTLNSKGNFLVLDGKKHKIDGIPLFCDLSENGEHYGAVLNLKKNKEIVNLDGKTKVSFDARNPVTHFYISPLGNHYITTQKDKTTREIKIKFDGTTIALADSIFSGSVSFSNDDQHYGFVILKKGTKRAIIVLDGKEIVSFDPNFSKINDCFKHGRKLIFSPSGTHLLYVAGVGSNQIIAYNQRILFRFDLYNTVIYNPYFSGEKNAGCIFLDKINRKLNKIETLIQ